jgi:hypothetical protein
MWQLRLDAGREGAVGHDKFSIVNVFVNTQLPRRLFIRSM